MTDAALVRESAQPPAGGSVEYDAMRELIGDARFVLLGEATHGTYEFYSERAGISKRLIAEKGFSILAIEADWPDSARVHRYVRGTTADANANVALSGFRRFPTWMWRNAVVIEFVEWLRDFNKSVDPKRAPVGFYGMDLYSLHASIEAVLKYLDKVDPESARRARLRYSCFDHFSRNPQEYGYATTAGAIESCEDAVVEQLVELQRKAAELERREQIYREGRPPPELRDRIVILVDDGLATGATMRAAVKALRQRGVAKIVVAVPVGPPDTCREFEEEADETICLSMPAFFQAVGQYYEDFSQTSDEDVRELLTSAAQSPERSRMDHQ